MLFCIWFFQLLESWPVNLSNCNFPASCPVEKLNMSFIEPAIESNDKSPICANCQLSSMNFMIEDGQ